MDAISAWFAVGGQVWFSRALLTAFASPAVACCMLVYAMRGQKTRQFSMLRPIFITLGIMSCIYTVTIFQLPNVIDLRKVSVILWIRIVLQLVLSGFIWRLSLYVKGVIN